VSIGTGTTRARSTSMPVVCTAATRVSNDDAIAATCGASAP
jgi:hypothetical protein